LISKEQYYLDNLKPEYNIAQVAGSTLGYKHTDESIAKMRDFVITDEVKIKKALATKNATDSRRVSIIVENVETKKKIGIYKLNRSS